MRTAFDFTPLYRSTIGFDRWANLFDTAMQVEPVANFPPYDVEKLGDDRYRITMAVAGFSAGELDLTAEPNKLTIVGQKQSGNSDAHYLYRGIAARGFKQAFNLADHVKVAGANLENGLLVIELAREVPEALKPRRIQVQAANSNTTRQIEHEDADKQAA